MDTEVGSDDRWAAGLHGGREADVLATYACVASARELWDTILLTRESKRNPYAEAQATRRGRQPSRSLQRKRVVDGWRSRQLLRAAARVATELARIADYVVAVAQSPQCTVLIALASQTMVLVDSRMPVWRFYQLSGRPSRHDRKKPSPADGTRGTKYRCLSIIGKRW